MEQIVKIFVHQSYFIDNDLVVDYNVEQEVSLFKLFKSNKFSFLNYYFRLLLMYLLKIG